mmetsp:Transcript_45286/g.135378  ORF Transcript_45286/g.135378 Transcript_45286/m.135378 type:complete len:245 (+) Transcript_45286:700-1434(+)
MFHSSIQDMANLAAFLPIAVAPAKTPAKQAMPATLAPRPHPTAARQLGAATALALMPHPATAMQPKAPTASAILAPLRALFSFTGFTGGSSPAAGAKQGTAFCNSSFRPSGMRARTLGINSRTKSLRCRHTGTHLFNTSMSQSACWGTLAAQYSMRLAIFSSMMALSNSLVSSMVFPVSLMRSRSATARKVRRWPFLSIRRKFESMSDSPTSSDICLGISSRSSMSMSVALMCDRSLQVMYKVA